MKLAQLGDKEHALIVSVLGQRVTLLRRASDPSHASSQSPDYELAVSALKQMTNPVSKDQA
jgi:hypothetical protein